MNHNQPFFKPENLVVFDIETIPDTDSCLNLIDDQITNLHDQRLALTNYHLKITADKNSFLRQPFHKIIAISFLQAKINYDSSHGYTLENYNFKEIKSGGNPNSSEEELVKGFFMTLDKLQPKLVSFNGRGFDIPVLKYRAMKYGITSEFFYLSGSKWESYNQKYALGWHCDLIDALSDFGASARIKLNEACSIFGFPGKFGINGSQITDLYDQGKLIEIRNYCETDVLNTYLVYLRYALHTCKISTACYYQEVKNILQYLQNSKKEHFDAFILQWQNCCKNDKMLPKSFNPFLST
ncbi:putative 3'-5' exonuclease related to the exonuclease domain of PolB [Candidatus Hepatincolaceae symbiont of Richtersius coronifer]